MTIRSTILTSPYDVIDNNHYVDLIGDRSLSYWSVDREEQPSGKNRLKHSLKECVFVNSALKIQCHYCQKYTPTDCFFGHFTFYLVEDNANVMRSIFGDASALRYITNITDVY